MPYPLSKKEVTTDFVVRVLASWRHLFRSVWGQVSHTDPEVKITWAGVFEELIGRLNSSDLMLMSSEYLLDQFAGILFRWFAIFSEGILFEMKGVLALESKSQLCCC